MKKLSFILIFCLIFFVISGLSNTQAAPAPSVSLNVPAQPFIGQNISFTASFDNTSATDTGWTFHRFNVSCNWR